MGTDNSGMGYDMPQLANQPPQIFGAYNSDGSPIPPVLNGQVFSDPSDGGYEDLNDPKRRRIARVCVLPQLILRETCADHGRHAICVGRRKSNAMARCPSVRIASITKPSASSPKSRRSATHPKGKGDSRGAV